MKKVIEQGVFTNVYIEVTSKTLHFTQKSAYPNSVVIEKSKAREVALAICPELESELKEAVELIKELHMTSGYNNKWHEKSELGIKSKAFLTKHKSK